MYLKILNENFLTNGWNSFCNFFYGPSAKTIILAVDPQKCKDLNDNESIKYAQEKITEILGNNNMSKEYADAITVTKDNSNLVNIGNLFNKNFTPESNVIIKNVSGSTPPNIFQMKYWDPTDPELKYDRIAIFGAALGLGIYGCYWLYNKMRNKSTPNQNDINEARNADQQKIIYGQ